MQLVKIVWLFSVKISDTVKEVIRESQDAGLYAETVLLGISDQHTGKKCGTN